VSEEAGVVKGRRRMYRVSVAHVIVAFALFQGADIVLPALGAPAGGTAGTGPASGGLAIAGVAGVVVGALPMAARSPC
jgi:hypothetical protein